MTADQDHAGRGEDAGAADRAGRPNATGARPQNSKGRALRLRKVTKAYPGGVHALRGVSVDIGKGEQVAVVGPSGSGKTTMLTVLGTLERPTSGVVEVAGRDVIGASDVELAGLRAHEIGFVFQGFHLQDTMTAVENVANGMLYTGLPAAERRQAARVALERVGLGHRLSHRPPQLSGGERQRVAIARAIAKRPLIILADEPTGNLDSKSGGEVLALLHGLASDGATLALITHDEQIASSFPRRVQMRDGEIVGDERR
jgi:putative ABC transport system ATP-binding protein